MTTPINPLTVFDKLLGKTQTDVSIDDIERARYALKELVEAAREAEQDARILGMTAGRLSLALEPFTVTP